jgi:general secretion pathway protein A
LNGQYRTNVLLLIQGHAEVRRPPLVHLNDPRITAQCHLEALSREDTRRLIVHRLRTAGAHGNLFSAEAFDEIYDFSHGYPRLINMICDRSLLTGYTEGLHEINHRVVQECASELQFAN